MNNLVVSVLIPSRARVDRLMRTIDSIYDTAKSFEAFDIIVRLDECDKESISAVSKLSKLARVMVGPRKTGYTSINKFYTDMADSSEAKWVWIMNDDCTIEHENKDYPCWDEQLAVMDTHKAIAQPEWYQNGGSKYRFCEGGAFPAVPNGIWKSVCEVIPDPADTALDGIVRKDLGGRTLWLNGINVNHQRDNDLVLAEHRKL